MTDYRKIYEQHYGSIPKDEDDRSYDIHHIDRDHSNNSPENLKAVTIREHYDIHYAQEDWYACLRIAERMELSSAEISELATKNNLSRVADGTHPFLGPENNLKRVADGTHPFLGGEVSRKINRRRVDDGTHNLLGPENNLKRVADGSHNFLGPDTNATRIEDGTHNFLGSQEKVKCPYCPKEGGKYAMKRWHFDNCKQKSKETK